MRFSHRQKEKRSDKSDDSKKTKSGKDKKHRVSEGVAVRNEPSNSNPQSSNAASRSVSFRDNRLPDGSTMPRIKYSDDRRPQHTDECGPASPGGGSVPSSGSIPRTFPSLASYPASYMPEITTKLANLSVKRKHTNNEEMYERCDNLYEEALPQTDYPLTPEGGKNNCSNRDSGLESESHSSSGLEKHPTRSSAHTASEPFLWADLPQRYSDYFQPNNLHHRASGNESVQSYTPEAQHLRPWGHLREYQTSSALSYRTAPSAGLSNLTSRVCRPFNHRAVTSSTQQCWPRHQDNLADQDFHMASQTHRPHCASCCCSNESHSRVRPLSRLKRTQLEEGPLVQRRDRTPAAIREGRRFRREDDEACEEVKRIIQGTLPRNQPIRGRFFEHVEEKGGYDRIAPVRRPTVVKAVHNGDYPDRLDDDEDNDDDNKGEFAKHPEDSSGLKKPGATSLAGAFYKRNGFPLETAPDRCVIRL